jgi:radical SAM protein with 4Fe4S-binding SPASM domain
MTIATNTTTSTDASAQPQNKVKFLWLELTSQCNLECIHCYEESSPRQPLLGSMTVEDWKRTLDQAADIGTTHVQFVGGEPTLHPHLEELIVYADELGLNSEVYTNGLKITPEMWDVFQRYNVALAISYYSSISDEHDTVTQRPGSHIRTQATIIRAQELGLSLRIGVIQVPGVSDGDIDVTVQELHDIGIERVGVDRMRRIGRGVIDPETRPDPFKELCGACGDNKLVIDNNGQVHPCIMSKFVELGHVSSGLMAMISGDRLSRFREDLVAAQPELADEDECVPDCGPRGSCGPFDSPPCNPHCCPKTVGDWMS